MPQVAFVMSGEQGCWLLQLAQTVQFELEQQGVVCSVHLGEFPELTPEPVYILLDPLDYLEIEGQPALPEDAILRRTIFLCTKAPPAAHAESAVALLERAGAVFAMGTRTLTELTRLRVTARLLRPGYSPALDHFDPEAERPIDVVFLGSHSLRRTRHLARAARMLARHECVLHLSAPDACPARPRSFLGEERWPLLARSKVAINLHRDEDSRLEWQRALDAIHAGAVLVTEHSSDLAPLAAGEHLLAASLDSLPSVVEVLLRDPEWLARLRTAAYERLRSWIPLALPVAVLRAAIVELVGEAVPPGASRGTVSRRPAPAPLPADVGEEEVEPSAAPAAPQTPKGFVRFESETWSGVQPDVSVVAVALEGEPPIAPSLYSVVSLVAAPGEVELVVVVAEAGEEGEADRWLAEHPQLPARLLVSEATGLGAARNVGLEQARGNACLILDSGQELYPRALQALSEALEDAPDAVFAYPIQEVTGAVEEFVAAGGDHLLSFAPWNPLLLRSGNPIHAPFLVRTERLRGAGGFTADPQRAGFEDYDLWCRFARLGWTGRLVPQVLARRRESGTSAALRSMRGAGGATAAGRHV